jgi:hypothetical protein
MDQDGSVIQFVRQEFLICIDQQIGRHHTVRIREHSIFGDDRKALYPQRHLGDILS